MCKNFNDFFSCKVIMLRFKKNEFEKEEVG